MSEITVIKVPMFYGDKFFKEIFTAAKETNTPIILVKGNIYAPQGGGATVNVIDRLFGFRGK